MFCMHRIAGALLPMLLLGTPAAMGQWPPWQETFVDPEFTDCQFWASWMGNGWGGGGALADDLDQDGWWGPAENLDFDAVYGTIATAIANTSPGGTVHLTVPGVYRERLTIGFPITIRAAQGIDVILEGGRGGCIYPPPPAGPGISVLAAGTVTLENLTVRGFTVGISAISDGFLKLVDCRVEENTSDGVQAGAALLELTRTAVSRNDGNGILFGGRYGGRLVMTDSEVTNNAQHGIQLGTADSSWTTATLNRTRILANRAAGVSSWPMGGPLGDLLLHECEVADNTGDGVFLGGTQMDFEISDSLVARNGDDGINLIYFAPGPGYATLAESRIERNGSDGIETNLTAAFGFHIAIWKNTIARNGGFGWFDAGMNAINTWSCEWNLNSKNAAGPEGPPGGPPWRCDVVPGGPPNLTNTVNL